MMMLRPLLRHFHFASLIWLSSKLVLTASASSNDVPFKHDLFPPAVLLTSVDDAQRNATSSSTLDATWVSYLQSLLSNLEVDIVVPRSDTRIMGHNVPIMAQAIINDRLPDQEAWPALEKLCRLIVSDSESYLNGEYMTYPFALALEGRPGEVAFPLYYLSGPTNCADDEGADGKGRLCYTQTLVPGSRRLWATLECADPLHATFGEVPSKPVAQASVSFFATHKMDPADLQSPDDTSLGALEFHFQEANSDSSPSSSSPPPLLIDWSVDPAIQAQAYCESLGRGQLCIAFVHEVLEIRHEERYFAWICALHEHILPSMDYSFDSLEGNTYSFPEKTKTMKRIMQERPEPQLICEIGFNAGHGALLWLLSRRSKDTRVLAFDIGHHAYTSHAVEFIHQYFGGESLELVIGSSVDTVPAYAKAHPDTACDVILVDGNHHGEIPLIDCENMMLLANRTSHVLLVDDSQMAPVLSAIQAMASTGRLVIDEKIRSPSFDTLIELAATNQLKWEAPAQLNFRGDSGNVDIGRYDWPEIHEGTSKFFSHGA